MSGVRVRQHSNSCCWTLRAWPMLHEANLFPQALRPIVSAVGVCSSGVSHSHSSRLLEAKSKRDALFRCWDSGPPKQSVGTSEDPSQFPSVRFLGCTPLSHDTLASANHWNERTLTKNSRKSPPKTSTGVGSLFKTTPILGETCPFSPWLVPGPEPQPRRLAGPGPLADPTAGWRATWGPLDPLEMVHENIHWVTF